MQIKSVHIGNLRGITNACSVPALTYPALISPCRRARAIWKTLLGCLPAPPPLPPPAAFAQTTLGARLPWKQRSRADLL